MQSELESIKSKLNNATKRADTAEKRKTALQNDNEELFKQLEEVREKVVQAMEEKAVLASEVEEWEMKGKGWERTKAEMEKVLEVKDAEAMVCRNRRQGLIGADCL